MITENTLRPDAEGVNPGENYVRIALVQSESTTQEALKRLIALN